MVITLKFKIKCNCSLEDAWKAITNPDLLNQWLSTENEIVLKKNGKFTLLIDDESNHNTEGCKISEIQVPNEKNNNEGKLVIFWKGPEKFDIIMNEFSDSWTHVEFTIAGSLPSTINIEHIGWKSSEDWQKAKEWHETKFWPIKIQKLKQLLN